MKIDFTQMKVLNMSAQNVVQQIFINSLLSVRHYSRWRGHYVGEKSDQNLCS